MLSRWCCVWKHFNCLLQISREDWDNSPRSVSVRNRDPQPKQTLFGRSNVSKWGLSGSPRTEFKEFRPSCIQQVYTKHLICARHRAGSWGTRGPPLSRCSKNCWEPGKETGNVPGGWGAGWGWGRGGAGLSLPNTLILKHPASVSHYPNSIEEETEAGQLTPAFPVFRWLASDRQW